MAHPRIGYHPHRIAGLGDAPLQVLGVLGPPEQFGHRKTDFLDDLASHQESAPRRPGTERSVQLIADGEGEGPRRILGCNHPQVLQAVRVGTHIVIDHPGVFERRLQKVLEGEGVATGRPSVVFGADQSHRRTSRREVGRVHRRGAGVVDHQDPRGQQGLGRYGLQTALQGGRGVVGEHDRHGRQLGVDEGVHLRRQSRDGGPG